MNLLDAARAEDRLAEVDWLCRAAAIRGALDIGLRRPHALFINVEPAVIAAPPPDELRPLLDRAAQELRIVVEITERALRADPAAILDTVARIRELGWEIALDDVGVASESLALLPLIQPDVVKLDMSLLHNYGDAILGSVADAVATERDRRDLVILAEGIENPEHLDEARVLGASLGQGWHFARPSDRPIAPDGMAVMSASHVAAPETRTPLEIIGAHHQLRVAEKRLLMPMSRQLESRIARDPDPAVLFGTFQAAHYFSPATAHRYTSASHRSPFVAAFATGLPAEPAPGVRGGDIAPGDDLARYWIVAVLGPHYAGALVAHDLMDHDVADGNRRFEFAISHRRDVVAPIVQHLMRRIRPFDG